MPSRNGYETCVTWTVQGGNVAARSRIEEAWQSSPALRIEIAANRGPVEHVKWFRPVFPSRECWGLLIRGGTTSVGLAAAAIAKKNGAFVLATTQIPPRTLAARERRGSGRDRQRRDCGASSRDLPERRRQVLELVGTTTLKDSLRTARAQGIVCMTGMVGDQWSFDQFSPMDAIPTAVSLTTYAGGEEDFMRTPLQSLADQVAAGDLRINIGRVFKLDDIVEAHCMMQTNQAGGRSWS